MPLPPLHAERRWLRWVLDQARGLAVTLALSSSLLGFNFLQTASLLLCVGITPAELETCRREGVDQMIERLRTAAVFPFTDLKRESVC